MLLVSRAANGSLSARRLPSKPPAPAPSHRGPNPYPLFANPGLPRRRLALSGVDAPRRPPTPPPPLAASGEGPSGSPAAAEEPVLVGVADDGVPLEGVIQIEKPGDAAAESKLVSYAKVGLLASGDVLCLLVFSAIGRFSHGLPVLDAETFKTADPFIAGWFLSAYLLGGFGDDAKGPRSPSASLLLAPPPLNSHASARASCCLAPPGRCSGIEASAPHAALPPDAGCLDKLKLRQPMRMSWDMLTLFQWKS